MVNNQNTPENLISSKEFSTAKKNKVFNKWPHEFISDDTVRIYDSKYAVHLGDFTKVPAQEYYSFIPNPDADVQIEIAERKRHREKKARHYALQREKRRKRLALGSLSIILFFTGGASNQLLNNIRTDMAKGPHQPIVASSTIARIDDNPIITNSYLNYTQQIVEEINKSATANNYQVLIDMTEGIKSNYFYPAIIAYDDYKTYKESGMLSESQQRLDDFLTLAEVFEERVIDTLSSKYSFASSPYATAIEIDGNVYIAESLANYNDGELPEGAINKNGILYIPEEKSIFLKSKIAEKTL